MGSLRKLLRMYIIVPLIFSQFLLMIPKEASAQLSDLEVTKEVDKAHIQRDDVDDRNIMYTLTVNTNGYCNAPLDIALLFDRSNSMNEPPENPPVELAKSATISFINQLDEQTDRISLTTYQTTASLDIPLTENFQSVISFVDSIIAEGYTDIGDALTFARDDIIGNQRGVQEVMILFTDGVWNRGPDPEPIAETIKNNDGIRIITVGIGPNADQTLLQNMASNADDFYYVLDPTDLEQTLINIARELQYGQTNIVLTDDISDILPYVEFVSAEDGGVLNGETIQWDLGINPCISGSFTTHFTVRVKDTTPDLTELLNDAVATDEPNERMALSNEVSTLVHAPILSMDKYHIPTNVAAGNGITYQIIVQNTGTGNAYGIVIKDTLPSQFLDIIEDTISDNGRYTGSSVVWDGNGNGFIINGSFSPENGQYVLDKEHIFSYQGIVSKNIPHDAELVNTVRLTSLNNPYLVLEDTDRVAVGEVLAATGERRLMMWIAIGIILILIPPIIYVSKRLEGKKIVFRFVRHV